MKKLSLAAKRRKHLAAHQAVLLRYQLRLLRLANAPEPR